MFSLFPAPVQAESGGRVLAEEEVEAALRHHFTERGPWQPAQLEVEVRSFTSLPLQAGAVELRVVKPREKITPGLRRFLLAVEVGGKETARVWVQAEIRVFAAVAVTSRPLAHYETVTSEDVRLERRDISMLSTRAFTDIAEVVGRQAACAIPVNSVLTPSLVGLPRVVRRGGGVTLVYETSGLRVETPGRAAEAGKVGDVIHVENPSSGKTLEGQILDAHTVRVNW